MPEKEYYEREAVIEFIRSYRCCTDVAFHMEEHLDEIPAADVRPAVVCADCEHNNHCLTQEFLDDCGKIPLDRSTFFCADGERRRNA